MINHLIKIQKPHIGQLILKGPADCKAFRLTMFRVSHSLWRSFSRFLKSCDALFSAFTWFLRTEFSASRRSMALEAMRHFFAALAIESWKYNNKRRFTHRHVLTHYITCWFIFSNQCFYYNFHFIQYKHSHDQDCQKDSQNPRTHTHTHL